jgi:FkbH-like protein
MREIVPGESRSAGAVAVGEPALAAMRALDSAVARRSQIVWAEHCTECAYPACYANCAHYTPRADLHCRRFADGIEAVRAPGAPEPLMRVRFRMWGKLQGDGPVPLQSRAVAYGQRVLRDAVGAVSDLQVLPFRWRYGATRAWVRAERIARKGSDPRKADAFVVECVSTSDKVVPFTLTILPHDRATPGLFQERLTLGGGYTRHVIPVSAIAARLDLSRPFVVKIEPLADSAEAFVFGYVDFVEWASAPAPSVLPLDATPLPKKPAAKAKCIVWDLDETVWEGILAEVGVEGVKLKPEVVAVIRALDARGILHSIASKNDEAEALAALRHFGIEELFLYPQVGWGLKSDSVRRVAKLLDIGVDTLAFVDDQPFERSVVAETLGCVTVFPHDRVEDLLAHPLFDVPVTAESSQRRLMYRDEMKRNEAFVGTGHTDYAAFLRSCDIRLNLSLLGEAQVERIYDLSQRTNQVNVTGTRYDRARVAEMARDAGAIAAGTAEPGTKLPIVMQCEDRFGDYGIIGFVLLDADRGVVSDYFMSCRVQRKYVENALFAHLARVVAARGGKGLSCRYKRTERNKLSLELLGALGFELEEDASGGSGAGALVRDLAPFEHASVVHVEAGGVR